MSPSAAVAASAAIGETSISDTTRPISSASILRLRLTVLRARRGRYTTMEGGKPQGAVSASRHKGVIAGSRAGIRLKAGPHMGALCRSVRLIRFWLHTAGASLATYCCVRLSIEPRKSG
jgi:hypothetical protein